MDRKDFLKTGILGTGIFAGGLTGIQALANEIDELKPLTPLSPDGLGFNHIPYPEDEKEENFVVHRADSRGNADHGWLKSRHTFSFADYYRPDRMHFGVLRVLNDDLVAPGMGFGMHPHDNMEIVSIPLEGDLEHKDSMGNVAIIKHGDVQVMSAGTGIRHSEFNKHGDKDVKFLQIWIFPNRKNVTPRYDQITLNLKERKNRFQQILSPSPHDEGVWIHQDAWFHLGDFEAGKKVTYEVKKEGNGIYLFLLKGQVNIVKTALNQRDGMGIWNAKTIDIEVKALSSVLIMEVPMGL